nr:hypothetical protein [Agreia bicolorata]
MKDTDLRHAQEDQGNGRGVEIRQHVDRINVERVGEHGEQRITRGRPRDELPARPPCEPSVGVEESELLHREPDEDEVQQTDLLNAAQDARGIDDHRQCDERRDGRRRAGEVPAVHEGEERLAGDEGREEPQRHAHACGHDVDECSIDAADHKNPEHHGQEDEQGQRGPEQAHES